MAEVNLKQGYEINLEGETEKVVVDAPYPSLVAIKPTDFVGLKPKLAVAEGDKVKIGTTLFFNKKNERVKFTSPASGVVKQIVRGARRAIQAVIVETDNKKTKARLKIPKSTASRDNLIDALLISGLFPFFVQRPFAIIANPDDTPRDIFISTMDTAPLAPDCNVVVKGQEKNFQTGLNVLKKLTSGKVHLSVNGSRSDLSKAFVNAKNAEIHKFTGPHPAGNVGVQIHHIDPVKSRDDVVWTCSVKGVILIGKLFAAGSLSPETIVAVAGSSARDRRYFNTILGASAVSCHCADDMHIDERVDYSNIRYISGNVLTGTKIEHEGFIGYYNNLVSIIPEREDHELFGWISPGFDKASRSFSFAASFLKRGKKFIQNTGINGGHRAFIVSEIYKKVFPMDIFPLFLIKSILVNDIEEMEGLGIFEVAEEDFALCEYIDPSKNKIQDIVRQGLNLAESEG